MYRIAIHLSRADVSASCSWLRASFPVCLLLSACSRRKRQQDHANYCAFDRLLLFTESNIRKTS
jgi:hypothetical protein